MVALVGQYDESAEPSGGFEPIPADWYNAQIIESDIQDISRNSDYGQCLVLKWEITEGEYEGRWIWQRLNILAENMNKIEDVLRIANQQFSAIRHATGVLSVTDSVELHNIPCRISVAIRVDKTGQYSPQNEIKSVKPVEGSDHQEPSPAQRQAPAPQRQATAPKQAAAGGSRPWKK